MTPPAAIYGVGLGPGAADLMSVRADRLVRGANHIAYFRKPGRPGHARSIVEGLLREDVVEFPMEYPVTTEIPLDDPRYNRIMSRFYGACRDHLLDHARAGAETVVLCEGDPFFYGSFMHLYTRLKDEVPVHIVPGITGMSAAWTATGAPITWGDDVLTVLMGTLPEDELAARMEEADAFIVMKMGRQLPKLRRALRTVGRHDAAWLVEFAAMPDQTVRPLSEVTENTVPYFSILVVHGQGRRP